MSSVLSLHNLSSSVYVYKDSFYLYILVKFVLVGMECYLFYVI